MRKLEHKPAMVHFVVQKKWTKIHLSRGWLMFVGLLLVLFSPPLEAYGQGTSSVRVDVISTDAMIPDAVQKLWGDGYGECDNENEDVSAQVSGLRIGFAGDDALYVLGCAGAGTYNTPYWVYAFHADRKFARVISFPILWGGKPSVQSEILNMKWDSSKMQISAFSKNRGLADCGVKSIWQWAFPNIDSEFVLIEQKDKEECDGKEDGFVTVWPNSLAQVE